MDTFDERVRQRAYRLWVEEGCPEGRSDIHWEKARELVGIEEKQKSTTRPAAAEAPRREPQPRSTRAGTAAGTRP